MRNLWKSQVFIRIFTPVGLIIVLALLFEGCTAETAGGAAVKGNPVLLSSPEDFKGGAFQSTSAGAGDDACIQLAKEGDKYPDSGTYTSPPINTEPFQTMLFSCNADTPEGTSIKIELQVQVDGKWSGWLPWGTWGAYIAAGSNLSRQEDDVAAIDEDVLTIKSETKSADAVKYRVTLNTLDVSVTPSVRSVAISTRNNMQENVKASVEENKKQEFSNTDRVLDVPKFSQTVREGKIAMRICSPTCVAMVLKYYGIDLLPEECAWGAYDNLAMKFGNWVFNCAYAGSYGFTAYADFFSSLDEIRREIDGGHPVIASVRYKNSESVEGDLPVVHGAPIDKTEGHLVVICGFVHENGKEYVVVNDPAAADDAGVGVKYLADEFYDSWFKVVYIIHKEDNSESKPRRTQAEFVPTGNKKQYMEGVSSEYRLECGDTAVDMSRDNIRTIMAAKEGEPYKYITPLSSETFWFNGEEGQGIYEFLIITAENQVYTAKINWTDE